MNRRWPILFLLFLFPIGAAFLPGVSTPASAQMPPTPTSDRLAPWPTVYPPAQADTGAQEYYQRCMVCHGDRGQGLTEEWRGALDPADQNCWQSGCHHSRHPPGGFVFPKAVPPVIGAGAIDHFGTAQTLFDFIKNTMPFQAPGSLSDEIYWQLTAYLVRENGFNPDGFELSQMTASSVALTGPEPAQPNPAAPEPSQTALWPVWGAAGVACLVLAGLVFMWLRKRGA